MNTYTIDRTEAELEEIHLERHRQQKLQAEGRFRYTLADQDMPEMAKLASIAEELGEVGRNLLAKDGLVTDGEPTIEALYKEVSHVAALAVAWMEALTVQMEMGDGEKVKVVPAYRALRAEDELAAPNEQHNELAASRERGR